MNDMDNPNPTIEQIAEAKAEHRRRRAALPFHEKIRILVRLQKRRAPIVRARGGTPRVWNIDPTPTQPTDHFHSDPDTHAQTRNGQ